MAGYAAAQVRSAACDRGFPAVDQAIEMARSIDNPSLISQGLALRVQLTSEANPGSPLLSADRDEHRQLCARHGLKHLV